MVPTSTSPALRPQPSVVRTFYGETATTHPGHVVSESSRDPTQERTVNYTGRTKEAEQAAAFQRCACPK